MAERIKAYLRVSINTHSSRAGGDHKRKRPKNGDVPKSPRACEQHTSCQKTDVEELTHDRMSGGKAAKRSTSGATSKKTTVSDETNHAAVSITFKDDDSSRWVSTLAPLTLLKAASKHAAKLNENRMLYNVSDATWKD